MTTQRLSVFFALFVLILSTVKAQQIARDGFSPGMRALQFSINNDFKPDTYNGTLLSFKKMTTDSKGRYFGISFGSSRDKSETESDRIHQFDSFQLSESRRSSNGLQLIAGRISYLKTSSDVKPFVAAGPSISFSRNTQQNDFYRYWSNENNTAFYLKEHLTDDLVNRQLGLGFQMRVGAQYFIAKNIGLHIEYGGIASVNRSYGSSTRIERDEYFPETTDRLNQTIESVSTTKGWSWNAAPLAIRFGLSAYF